MYFDYNDYVTYYGKGVCFQDFNRLSIEACRKLDNHTTGADGVKFQSTHPVGGGTAKVYKK